MTVRRACGAAWLALLWACGGPSESSLVLPPAGGAQTAIIAIGDQSFVLDLRSDTRLDADVPEDATVEIAYYGGTTEQMLLTPGRFESVKDGRKLPSTWLAVHEVPATGGEWVERPGLTANLEAIRLERFFEDCAMRGGCWRGEEVCNLPCGEPEIAEPRPPEIVCPDGWSAEPRVRGLPFCRPDVPPRGTCTKPERGTPFGACVRTGSECPVDGWPAGVEDAGRPVLYVRAGEMGGGTRSRPYGTLAEAVAAATPGSTIAVAPGTYGPVRIEREDVWLVGACPDQVVVASTSTTAIEVLTPDVRVVDLGLQSTEAGLIVWSRASAEVVGTIVEGRIAAIVGYGQLDLRDAVLESSDTTLLARQGDLVASDVDIRGGRTGVVCAGGTAQLADFVIDGPSADGVRVEDGCQASIERIRIDGAADDGVIAFGATTDLQVTDVVIRDGGADPENAPTGIGAIESTVSVERYYAQRVGDVALGGAEDASMTARDVFIEDTFDVSRPAVPVLAVATIDLKRAYLKGAYLGGIDIRGGRGILADIVIEPSRVGVNGINVGMVASASLNRITIVGRFTAALDVDDGAGVRTVRDLWIEGASETGFAMASGQNVRLERIQIQGAVNRGLQALAFVTSFSKIDAFDLSVECAPGAEGVLWGTEQLVERFAVRGCATGMTIGSAFVGSLEAGLMAENDVALAYDEDIDLGSSLIDVRFEDNQIDLEPFMVQ